MTIFVIATLRVDDANVPAVTKACLDGMPAASTEAGCLAYDFLATTSDRNKLLYLEQWTDRAAFDAHLSGPNVAAWSKAVDGKVAGIMIDVITSDRIERL